MTPEIFDFDALDEREDEVCFRRAPSRYVFGGNPLLIEQRRLPNENHPELTGSEVWPASIALAKYLERESLRKDVGSLSTYLVAQGKVKAKACCPVLDAPQGLNVLELGAGLGLVGLAAKALGARRAFLTDVASALPGLERNVALNHREGTCEVLEVDWYRPEETNLPADSIDLVCCSDCVLWPELFEPLCNTLDHFMREDSVALLSVVYRCAQVRDFFTVLEGRMKFEEVWASKPGPDSEGGRIRIYRVCKQTFDSKLLEQSLAYRSHVEFLSTTALERIVGVPAGSITDFKPNKNGCRRGVHSVTCHLELRPGGSAHRDGQAGGHEVSVPASVFVKQVMPACQDRVAQPGRWRTANSDMAWFQDAATYQVEINWFDQFNEELRARGARLPWCYMVWSEGAKELSALVGHRAENFGAENAVADGGVPGLRTAVWADSVSSQFVSIIEDFAEPRWTQHLYLSEPLAQAALGMLADFHGASMGDDEMLEDARHALHEQGTYWAPEHRQPGELQELEGLWQIFMQQFRSLDEELFTRPEVQALGVRLREVQGEVDEGLRGWTSQRTRGRALVHGDLRTANLFFSVGAKATEVVPVNFRWSGLGFCAQDVAYLLISSAELSLLSDGKALRRFIAAAYLKPLKRKVGPHAVPFEAEFFRMFRLACLDYAKIVWSYHLAYKSPAWLQAASKSIGWCAHNRSADHALGFVRFVCGLLEGVEVPGYAD